MTETDAQGIPSQESGSPEGSGQDVGSVQADDGTQRGAATQQEPVTQADGTIAASDSEPSPSPQELYDSQFQKMVDAEKRYADLSTDLEKQKAGVDNYINETGNALSSVLERAGIDPGSVRDQKKFARQVPDVGSANVNTGQKLAPVRAFTKEFMDNAPELKDPQARKYFESFAPVIDRAINAHVIRATDHQTQRHETEINQMNQTLQATSQYMYNNHTISQWGNAMPDIKRQFKANDGQMLKLQQEIARDPNLFYAINELQNRDENVAKQTFTLLEARIRQIINDPGSDSVREIAELKNMPVLPPVTEPEPVSVGTQQQPKEGTPDGLSFLKGLMGRRGGRT